MIGTFAPMGDSCFDGLTKSLAVSILIFLSKDPEELIQLTCTEHSVQVSDRVQSPISGAINYCDAVGIFPNFA